MKYLLTSGKFIFLCFLILYTGIAYCFTYILEIYHNDALSRTALAFFTIYGRDPHWAAVGFIWQPLPSLLQVPFLQLLKPLNLMLMAGPITTAICGALSVSIIYKISQLLNDGKKTFTNLIITLLFAVNPLIILYSSIGTSEMIFLICLLISSYYLVKYNYSLNQSNLLLASLAISFSFWSKYEAVPAFAGSMLAVIFSLIVHKRSFGRIESTLLQYALPFFYSVLIWIFINWLIMKDPFYFLTSPYSNASYTDSLKTSPGILENSYHSITGSLRYVVNRVLYLAPVIWLIPALGIPLKTKRNRLSNLLLISFLTFPYAAILIFHSFQLFQGASFGWLRFYVYGLPLGTFLAFYFAKRHKVTAVFAIALMTIGIYTTWFALNNSLLGKEENSFAKKITDPTITLDFSRTFADQKQVAAFIDTVPGTVLLDTGEGFAIPLFSQNPNRFVITSDIDYPEIVRNFPSRVNWVIVPEPSANNKGHSIIHELYPGIWKGDTPYLTLEKQIESWKIFKVTPIRQAP